MLLAEKFRPTQEYKLSDGYLLRQPQEHGNQSFFDNLSLYFFWKGLIKCLELVSIYGIEILLKTDGQKIGIKHQSLGVVKGFLYTERVQVISVYCDTSNN